MTTLLKEVTLDLHVRPAEDLKPLIDSLNAGRRDQIILRNFSTIVGEWGAGGWGIGVTLEFISRATGTHKVFLKCNEEIAIPADIDSLKLYIDDNLAVTSYWKLSFASHDNGVSNASALIIDIFNSGQFIVKDTQNGKVSTYYKHKANPISRGFEIKNHATYPAPQKPVEMLTSYGKHTAFAIAGRGWRVVDAQGTLQGPPTELQAQEQDFSIGYGFNSGAPFTIWGESETKWFALDIPYKTTFAGRNFETEWKQALQIDGINCKDTFEPHGGALFAFEPSLTSPQQVQANPNEHQIRPINFLKYTRQNIRQQDITQNPVEWDEDSYRTDLLKTPSMRVTANSKMQVSLRQDLTPTMFSAFAVDIKTESTAYPYSVVFTAPMVLGITFLSDTEIEVHFRDRDTKFNYAHQGKQLRFTAVYESPDTKLYINGTEIQKVSQRTTPRQDNVRIVGLDIRGTNLGNQNTTAPTDYVASIGSLMIHSILLDQQAVTTDFNYAKVWRDYDGNAPMRSPYLNDLDHIEVFLQRAMGLPSLSGVEIVSKTPDMDFGNGISLDTYAMGSDIGELRHLPVAFDFQKEQVSLNGASDFTSVRAVKSLTQTDRTVSRLGSCTLNYNLPTPDNAFATSSGVYSVGNLPFNKRGGSNLYGDTYEYVIDKSKFEFKRVTTAPVSKRQMMDWQMPEIVEPVARTPLFRARNTKIDSSAGLNFKCSLGDYLGETSWLHAKAVVDTQHTGVAGVEAYLNSSAGWFNRLNADTWILKKTGSKMDGTEPFVINMRNVKASNLEQITFTMFLQSKIASPRIDTKIMEANSIEDAVAGRYRRTIFTSQHNFTQSNNNIEVVFYALNTGTFEFADLAYYNKDYRLFRVSSSNKFKYIARQSSTIYSAGFDLQAGLYLVRYYPNVQNSCPPVCMIKIPDGPQYHKYFTGELLNNPELVDTDIRHIHVP